jgi:hypothetical protein
VAKQKEKEPKALEPWVRRPWPLSGDSDVAKLYASIGCALTAWERFESELAFLFAQFVSPTLPSAIHPAIHAYCAVRTFHGRLEMLQAASESFFYGWGIKKDDRLVKKLKSLLNPYHRFNDRRNDIAHGVVDAYIPEVFTVEAARRNAGKFGHALFPTYGCLKDRAVSGFPDYCYTAAEIDYFRDQFLSLMDPAHILAAEISTTARLLLRTTEKSASRSTSQLPVRT